LLRLRTLEEALEAGLLNADFGAASFENGMRMVAAGEAAHYPMLTFAIGNVQNDIPKSLVFFLQGITRRYLPHFALHP
jgi:raffinose/stachyose/melibiose transport system substrate-binding protein